MSDLQESPILAKPEALLAVPVGLSSPLWGFYAGAAASGAAWWWMTRWTRPENLEALFGKAAQPAAAVLEAPVEVVEAAAPAIEVFVEAAIEPVEAAEEVAAESVAEVPVEPPVLEEPVGGEAASVGPVLVAEPDLEAGSEAAPAPKPRLRKVEPKAD